MSGYHLLYSHSDIERAKFYHGTKADLKPGTCFKAVIPKLYGADIAV
jgi:hypothetical protein